MWKKAIMQQSRYLESGLASYNIEFHDSNSLKELYRDYRRENNMRNKIISMICTICFILMLTACSTSSASSTVAPSSLDDIPTADNINVVIEEGDSMYDPQSLEEVEGLAEYIVRGKLLDDAKQKLEFYESEFVGFGVTVSSLEISNVYKGNLKEGDKIPIAERYYTLEENGVTTRHELGYAPSVPNQEYIFFLIKAPDDNKFLHGFYSPMVKETGRYPVIGTNNNDNFPKLNLVQTNPETYNKIYKEVKAKYMQ